MKSISSRPSAKGLVLDAILFGGLLGALILVLTQPTDDDLLALGRNSLITILCLTFGGVLGYASNLFGWKTLGEFIFEPPYRKGVLEPKVWFRTFWGLQLIVAFSVAFVAGIKITEFNLAEIFSEEGFAGATRIFWALAHPNFEILPQGVLAIFETIFIAFMATVLAIPLAFFLSFLCAKNVMENSALGLAIYVGLRSILNVTRSVEPIIWAIVFSVWVGIGPFAGMLALMLHSVASLAKQYSEQIECVERGPIEGIQATGADFIQVLWFAVVPQIVLPFVAFTIFRWDINVRMATIIGLVGGGGIGTMLMQYQGQALWQEVGCLVLLIAIAVWLMDTASAYLRDALK